MLSNSFLADYLRYRCIFEAYIYSEYYNSLLICDFWYFLKVKSIFCVSSLQNNMREMPLYLKYYCES